MTQPVSTHTLQSAIVLEDHRLVYVPAPKAASTTVLWALARLVGLSAADFERSAKLEVTRALAIHDLSVWGRSRLLVGRSAREIQEILTSADWFRFTVVRDPTRRLWSAWVSKLLVRDPRFVAVYADEDWFPATPSSSRDVVDSFRRFVSVLPDHETEWHDPHWSPQSALVSIDTVAYDHVGRSERLNETLEAVSDHLGVEVSAPPPENAALLPFSPELFDQAALAASDPFTAADRQAFAYERLAAATEQPPPAWLASVESSLGAIRGVIERNERVGDLRELLGREERRRRLRGRAARRS